ncbi:unnamed protein product [Dicrocoelium dendriticum]|nr:unnamed protein product [Dicrocoelium dendriticum]
MDDNGSKLESVLKHLLHALKMLTDSLQAQTTSAADELSLDRFFQMAGVEPSQLEALCSSERDGGTPVTHDSTEKLHAYDTAITLEQKYNGMGATAPSRAEEEANSYRRKLAAYQEGQQKQALLIQKLQAKLQTTTENLNLRVEASEARARALEQERSHQLEGTLVKLHEEQQRANELIQTNEILRDQLNQAVQANQGLSQDVARLTLAWRNAAQQLDKRETEWREEESAFNDYFAAEHSRLLALWRAVVGLRRQFGDLRQHTDRDLIYARNELTRYVRSIQSVCGNLEVNIRAAEAEAQSHLKRESKHATAVELEAADRVRSLTESLARSQARLAETEHKMTELVAARERLASQLADRDRILSTMSQLRSGISYLDGSESKHRKKAFKRGKRSLHPESEASEEGDESVQDLGTSLEDNEDHLKATKRLIEHTHVMHRALGQIAQLVISDSLIADADEAEEPTLNPQHPDWSAGRDSARSLEARSQKSEESLVAHGRPDEERVGAQSTSSLLAIEVHDGAESDQTVQRMYAISPSEMGQLRRLAHSKYQAGSSSHLAESALSAVQAALNRRAAHPHSCHLRLRMLFR